MRKNFHDLTLALNIIDTNPTVCMNFLNNPELVISNFGNMHLHIRPLKNDKICKMDIVFAILRSTVMQYNYPRSLEECETKIRELYTFLDTRYHTYVWRLHDVHFHTDFGQYVNCTYTTASELSETVSKIMEDYFHA